MPDGIRNIVTTVVTGGVSMVIIFAIDKKFLLRGLDRKKTDRVITAAKK